jgi:hypothetical protein
MPWIISTGADRALAGTKNAVASPAVATPKLIDSIRQAKPH